MMKLHLILAVMFLALAAGAAPGPGVVYPYEMAGEAAPESKLDKAVFAQLQQLGIQPSHLCSDAVFVRRIYLDCIGTLPTAFQARDFILDNKPNKRRLLIDQLLEREEFADYWAMKWSDLLRVKAEFPINLWPNAAQAYHRWIRTCVKENWPYDRFARELLTASGSNFRVPQVNFYRAMQNREPQGIAQIIALNLMGARAEKWPTNLLAGMSAFFSKIGYKCTAEWKEEIIFFDTEKTNGWPAAIFPDGTSVKLTPDRDPREIFADWLIQPKNPWFTRNIANRVWSWFLGRGVIQEPDDIRDENPPVNPELLKVLEQELVNSKYDLKQLFRLILNSKTYQLSAIPRSAKPEEAEAHFACYPLRRIEAEVLIDALNQITGTTEKYSSPIPEPFTFVPEDQRSIALPDGSITSSFLEMFGRPSRDTGLESERNNRPTAAQRLHLLNSSHIQKKISQSRMMQNLTQAKKTPRELATGLYLQILSRFPTDTELRVMRNYSFGEGREAAEDLAWALINSPEFLYRH